jgi:hypothetical protein
VEKSIFTKSVVYIFRHDACNYERLSCSRSGQITYEAAGTGRPREWIPESEIEAARIKLFRLVSVIEK